MAVSFEEEGIRTQTGMEGRPGEHIGTRCPSTSPEDRPQKEPTLSIPRSLQYNKAAPGLSGRRPASRIRRQYISLSKPRSFAIMAALEKYGFHTVSDTWINLRLSVILNL